MFKNNESFFGDIYSKDSLKLMWVITETSIGLIPIAIRVQCCNGPTYFGGVTIDQVCVGGGRRICQTKNENNVEIEYMFVNHRRCTLITVAGKDHRTPANFHKACGFESRQIETV